MKSILRRALGCITAAMLMCALPVLAFAAEGDEDGNGTPNPPDPTYSITVVNGNKDIAADGGLTISAYKVMDVRVTDVETTDGLTKSYDYTFTQDFASVTYLEGGTTLSDADLINALNKQNSTIDAAVLAEKLAEQVKTNSISCGSNSEDMEQVNGVEQAVINELEPGYYLVTITAKNDAEKNNVSLPILVLLTADNPQQTVYAKLESPQISKMIVDDGIETQLTSVDVGSIKTFKVTTFVPVMGNGFAENGYSFTITDTYSQGIVPNMETLSVSIANESVSLKSDDNPSGLYTVTLNDDSFVVAFDARNFYDGYSSVAGAPIEITYEATITEDIIEADDQQATNTVNLTYPDVPANPPSDEVTIFSFAIDVWKYSPDPSKACIEDINKKGQVLPGAKFVLYKMVGDTKSYYKYENDVVSWVGENQSPTELTTNDDGHLVPCFKGLAADTYYLVETEAPDGYNKLSEPVEIKLTTSEDQDYGITHKQPVANSKGIVLPGTGGMGTIIFYCVGGALVLGALIVLIARRRMASRDK